MLVLALADMKALVEAFFRDNALEFSDLFMGKDTSDDDITKVGRILHFSLQEGIKDLGKTF